MSEFWNAFWAKMFSVENAEQLAEVISIFGVITFVTVVVFTIGAATFGILYYMPSRGDEK